VVQQAAKDLAHHILKGIQGLNSPTLKIGENWPIYVMGGTFNSQWKNLFIDQMQRELSALGKPRIFNLAAENPVTTLVIEQLQKR
jgi:hypothetical protein